MPVGNGQDGTADGGPEGGPAPVVSVATSTTSPVASAPPTDASATLGMGFVAARPSECGAPLGPVHPVASTVDFTSLLPGDWVSCDGSFFGLGVFNARGIELTTYRAVARAHTALGNLENSPPKLSAHAEPPGKRNIYQRGSWRPATILRPEHLTADLRIDGLAVVEMPDTTIIVGEGQWAEVDAHSNLIIHLGA